METRAGDPGAFASFDLSRVDSPAFVVDAARLRANLTILADIRGLLVTELVTVTPGSGWPSSSDNTVPEIDFS
jgi:hypothetical protein